MSDEESVAAHTIHPLLTISIDCLHVVLKMVVHQDHLFSRPLPDVHRRALDVDM